MKHFTESNTTAAAHRPVPFLWDDINQLQDTHSLRIDPHGKGRGSWANGNVKTVRHAIKRYLRNHDLPLDEGYAVPLCAVYVYLTHENGVGEHNSLHAEQARGTLVAALNAHDNGLEIVRQRRLEFAS